MIGGVPFVDDRVPRTDWPALKLTTKFGQLPIMTITQDDGTQVGDVIVRGLVTS